MLEATILCGIHAHHSIRAIEWQAEKADFINEIMNEGSPKQRERRPSTVKALEQQGAALSEAAEAAMQKEKKAANAPPASSGCCMVQ
jgi:hypothetical protein